MDDTSMHELDLRPSEVKEWPILSYGIKSLGVPNSRATKKNGIIEFYYVFQHPPPLSRFNHLRTPFLLLFLLQTSYGTSDI